MCLESGRTVGAEDPEVLDPVVVRDTIDVVENHAHDLAPPELALAAALADRLLEPGLIEPFFRWLRE
jgi:hypothetical protein